MRSVILRVMYVPRSALPMRPLQISSNSTGSGEQSRHWLEIHCQSDRQRFGYQTSLRDGRTYQSMVASSFDFLPRMLRLRAQAPSPLPRATIYLLFGLVTAACSWAAL